METLPEQLKEPLTHLLLALADDKLMLGHRNSDWTGLGPILEEDIAFSHLAQDEIAHAQAIYEFIGNMIKPGAGGADELAFGRTPEEYRCAHIVEVPDEFDWATAMARKFYCDHFDLLRLNRLAESTTNPWPTCLVASLLKNSCTSSTSIAGFSGSGADHRNRNRGCRKRSITCRRLLHGSSSRSTA